MGEDEWHKLFKDPGSWRPLATSTTHLLLGLCFLHVVSANFDARGEQGAGEIRHPQSQEAAELLGG